MGSWIQAKQTQTNSVFFQMPIELKISFTTGVDTLIKVMNDMNNQMFYFTFTRQPSSVQFDPDNQIVLKWATLRPIAPVPVELSSLTASSVVEYCCPENGRLLPESNNKGFDILNGLRSLSPCPSGRGKE